MSWSGICLLVTILIFIIIKSFQNHIQNKNLQRKKKIFSTKDLITILLNAGFVVGGIVTILIGIGLNDTIFGTEIKIALPVIFIVAGVLFIWFGVRYLFWGGKD